jgi:hypothetical protein
MRRRVPIIRVTLTVESDVGKAFHAYADRGEHTQSTAASRLVTSAVRRIEAQRRYRQSERGKEARRRAEARRRERKALALREEEAKATTTRTRVKAA